MNLWILTEERPKKNVIEMIAKRISKDYHHDLKISDISIKPIIEENKFTFTYEVFGIDLADFNRILIKIVSGGSSFVDFLVYFEEEEPTINSNPLYVIEETKTSDAESRNTGVYQRCSKFVYVTLYYPYCKKIMLYNIRAKDNKKPTETNIFGTRMLLTLGVEIMGKELDNTIFKKFESIDEFIRVKDNMRAAPTGNVPILIKKYDDKITVSGRLFKKTKGGEGLSHDPNIGALSIISKTLRELGWDKDIVITQHGLSQQHVGRTNKFIKIANEINIKLDGLTIPETELPKEYWHLEKNSEKLATIFLHIVLEELDGVEAIYENHAGCERGYFKTESGELITIHKYIKNVKSNGIIYIPDLIIYNKNNKEILNIEGKTYANKSKGLEEINNFDAIEEEYIDEYWKGYDKSRWLVLYGGETKIIEDDKVAFILNEDGKMIVSEKSPEIIRKAIQDLLGTSTK